MSRADLVPRFIPVEFPGGPNHDDPDAPAKSLWAMYIGDEHTRSLVEAKSVSACVAALGAIRGSLDGSFFRTIGGRLPIAMPPGERDVATYRALTRPISRGVRLARMTEGFDDAIFAASAQRGLPRRFDLVHPACPRWDEQAEGRACSGAHGIGPYSRALISDSPFGPSIVSFTIEDIGRAEARRVGLSNCRRAFRYSRSDWPKPFYFGQSLDGMVGQNGARVVHDVYGGPILSMLAMRQSRIDRRLWVASIGVEDRVVSVATDPRHASLLFKSRDRVPPRRRRAALVHWVKSHSRNLGPVSVDVVAHLRGVREFSWNGFDVRIDPAEQTA